MIGVRLISAPTVGLSDGARSIWNVEHSTTWTRDAQRRQIENRHADVAAHRDVAPCLTKDVGDQSRGRRLAVVPVIATSGASGARQRVRARRARCRR